MTTATPATVAKAVKPAPVKIILSLKAIRAAKAFSNAKDAIKKAEERKARAEAILREALGDATIGTTADGLKVVSVMASSNSKYDSEVLKTRFPEAEAAAKKTTAYTYLRTA